MCQLIEFHFYQGGMKCGKKIIDLCFIALQRDGEDLQQPPGQAVLGREPGPRHLQHLLRDQLRDHLQVLRRRAGRARVHHGAGEEMRRCDP